jgi:hypothetical protein
MPWARKLASLSAHERRVVAMTLNFSNPSRSYDEAGNRMRFWGYDGALEVAFFMEVGAFKKISAGTSRGEAALLTAFDRNRDKILEVAGKVYSRGRQSAYTLTASDF